MEYKLKALKLGCPWLSAQSDYFLIVSFLQQKFNMGKFEEEVLALSH